MLPKKTQWIAILGIALSSAGLSLAQSADNQALINLLIKKGVLTDTEAKEISAEVAKAQSSENVETSGDQFIRKITIGGRWQVDYVGLGTSIDGTALDPVPTNHFLLRRMYVNVGAQFDDGFSANLSYDVANAGFNQAILQWKQSDVFSIRTGLDKAPFGYEELINSGDLRAIERSVTTNYFDNPNNGRRLGASAYRTGLWVSGTDEGFFYTVALTNPERNEYSGDSTNTAVLVNGIGGVGTTGTASTNKLAYYGTVGYGAKFSGDGVSGSYKFGYEAGYLPDQGGPAATLGTGRNIILNGAFADLIVGGFELQGEWEEAQDDSGVSNGHDAKPYGWWIQPTYRFTPHWEAVVNYSYLNSDGRGVALSDVVRSAPSGGNMNTAKEWYLGFNYYFKGNDVKLQSGYVYGATDTTLAGKPAHAETNGLRSQFQVQF